jgi:CheY-like chemotaxis protein
MNRKIFLIDDDEDDQELFKEALQEIDPVASLSCFPNAIQAIEELRTGTHPDFVFLDLNLPCINGKQFLKIFRENKSWTSIPVIIYTTSKLEEDVIQTKVMGAQHFLTKPKYFNQLKKAVDFIFSSEEEDSNYDMDEYIESEPRSF